MFVCKRKWRYWKRCVINNLYRRRITLIAAFIEDLFCRGNNIVSPPSVERLGIMFRANHVRINSYQTYAYDASKRKEYFQELMKKYHAFEPYEFGNFYHLYQFFLFISFDYERNGVSANNCATLRRRRRLLRKSG